jgi:hypothetical protein
VIKTYHGACHCGAVRFSADIDLALGSLRCNCSICARTRFWAVIVAPESFRILEGCADLVEYAFHTGRNRHYFCRRCGVRAFGLGETPEGQRTYGINVGCIEGLGDAELAAIPIAYVDGRRDAWHVAPAVTRHL